MFRAQQNEFDDLIVKCTDENLTSEDWGAMMDTWEKINESGENGPKDAVLSLIKRLAHRNANVQLYTLELANALSQNCGKRMHRELCSRSFTDALLRLAGDRNTHQTVKAKILERMAEWTEMFASDSELGIMDQAYSKLKSQNPNIQAPSKPNKREITDVDRKKEEDELQMALQISLRERYGGQAGGPANAGSSSGAGSSSQDPQREKTPPPVTNTTAATVSRVRALYDFTPTEAGELPFKKGDIIAVLESVYKDWWKGSLRGQIGIFPLNYVEKLSDPTPDELRKDAQMEAEVFAQVKNVEKLLAMLSTSDSHVQDNDEITALYHSTLAIRPKLIELIGKYSQKKDDFISLNEKFIKARRDYEALLETSMSHPQPNYGRHSSYHTGDYNATPQPQAYYAPHSAVSPHAPQNSAFAPPPSASGPPYPVSGRPSFPPETQGGPATYYMGGQVPPGAASPTPSHAAPPSDYGRPPSAHPAQSDNQSQPHELATSAYDTPIADNRPSKNFEPPQLYPQASPRPVSPGRPGGYTAYHRPTSQVGNINYGEPPLSPINPPTQPYPSAPGQYPPQPESLRPGVRPAYSDNSAPQDFYRTDNLYIREGRRT